MDLVQLLLGEVETAKAAKKLRVDALKRELKIA
jgi:hypothetical protein